MKNYNENVAYDLKLFEPKKEQAVPVARKKVKAKVKNPTTQLRPMTRARYWRGLIRTFSTITVMIILFGAMLYIQAQINEVNIEINKMNVKIDEEQSKQTRLLLSLESRMSLSEVEKYATEILGMKKVEGFQINYVQMTQGDKIVIDDQNIGETNLASKISKSVVALIEYLR